MTDAIVTQLKALSASYEIVNCDPDLADTSQFCEASGYSMDDSANAIVVAGKAEPTKYVMCLVLADMEIAGVTPFGSATPLELWIDAKVMTRSKLIIGGGSRDRKLLVPPATLAAHPKATVIEDLAR